jgi:prepilin-type N-terminal cleavage/methylation domain-containing protein
MDGYFLNMRLKIHGFSLLEMSMVMSVAAILATAVIPMAIRSMEIKAAEKTAMEIEFSQQASRKYYKDNGQWPADFQQLKTAGYLSSQWTSSNPWHNPYVMTLNANSLSIATDVPSYLTGVLVMRLPQTSVANTLVTSTIVSPLPDSSVPSGVIVAWSGTIADIPQGWALCDGTNGTLDLRDKFIVGARQDDAGVAKTMVTGSLSQKGGTISHNHGGNTGLHTLTVAEMPSHQHASWGEAFVQLAPWGVSPQGSGHLGDHDADYDNYYYLTSPQGGDRGHTHPVSEDMHVPPYYALAYIMKI